MLRNTLSALSASVVLAAAAITPNAALAFGLPPIGPPPIAHLGPPPMAHLGPPPMAHLGGPPMAHLGGPRFSGPAARGPAGLSRFSGGRSVASGYGRSSGHGYGRSGRSGYGHGYSRYSRWARYGAYDYGSGGSSSDDGCYYTYTSRGRRVAVCDEN